MLITTSSLKQDFGTPNCKVKRLIYEQDPNDYRTELIESVEVEKENDPFTGGYSIIRSRKLGLRIS